MPVAIFPREPGSVRAARRFVREVLTEEGLPSWSAELLVSELATNAVWHASSDFAVDVSVNGVIRVEVADDASQGPEILEPERSGVNERGLLLIRSLAADWGVDADDARKSVWFELPLDDVP